MNSNDPEQRVRRRLGRQDSSRWFGVSIALHLIAAVLLVYFTPLRQIVTETFEPTKPENTMSSEVLNEVAESLEARAETGVRDNIRQQMDIERQMDELLTDVAVRYEQFRKSQQQQAAEEALEEMTSALEQMEKSLESIEADEPISTIDTHQALAQQAQDRAGSKLQTMPTAPEKAVQLHDQAREKHLEAKEHHNVANQAQAAKRRPKADKQELVEAKEQLEKRLAAEQAEPEPNQRRVKRTRNDIKKRQERIDRVQQQLEDLDKQKKQAHKQAAEAQKQAIDVQKKAIEELEEQIERQKPQQVAAVANGEQTDSDASASQVVQPMAAAARDKAQKQVDSADVPELYEAGKTNEDSLAKKLKEIRAMDLAMVRDITLEEAREDIDLVRPDRPELNAELIRRETPSDKSFEAKKQELKKALRETNSMVTVSYQMLDKARESAENLKFGASVEMAEEMRQEQEEFMLRIRDLAMEDVSGAYADMSAAMQQMEQMDEQPPPPMPELDYEDLTSEEEQMSEEMRQLALNSEGDPEGILPQLVPEMVRVPARKVMVNSGRGARFIYVDRWWTIGPWPNPARRNIDKQYPPETLVDLDASYRLNSGKVLKWEYIENNKARMTPAKAQQYGIWYGYTEVYFEEAMDMLIAMGTDDRGTMWINGVPVWISSTRLKGWDIDEVWRKVHFKKGRNKILFRLENGWLWTGFSLTMMMPRN